MPHASGLFLCQYPVRGATCALPSAAPGEVHKGTFAAWLGADGLSPGKAAADTQPSQRDA
jgi:hypothetical protein